MTTRRPVSGSADRRCGGSCNSGSRWDVADHGSAGAYGGALADFDARDERRPGANEDLCVAANVATQDGAGRDVAVGADLGIVIDLRTGIDHDSRP